MEKKNLFLEEAEEKLKNMTGSPSWIDIMLALQKTDEEGNHAAFLGISESFYDNSGVTRMMERFSICDISRTPGITMAGLDIEENDDGTVTETHTYYDPEGNSWSEKNDPEDPSRITLPPGHYTAAIFKFTAGQREEKRRFVIALENHADELKKIDMENPYMQVPSLSITAVPLIYGGRYFASFNTPLAWYDVDAEDEKGNIVYVIFSNGDVMFGADPSTDPNETFKKARSELATEWIREENIRRREEEAEAYRIEHEKRMQEQIAGNAKVMHTFRSSLERRDEPEEG